MNRTLLVDGKKPSISQLKAQAKDKPCFLLGHSASLKTLDLGRLSGHYTAGINWTLDLFFPSLMFYMDQQPIGLQYPGILAAKGVTSYVVRGERRFPLPHFLWGISMWYRTAPIPRPRGVEDMLACTGTSASAALLWLWAAGFDPIVMIGIDFDIPIPQLARGAHFDQAKEQREDTHASDVPAISSSQGFNAFIEADFFKKARETLFEPVGRMLVNASPVHNPEFDVLERMEFNYVCEKLNRDGHLR